MNVVGYRQLQKPIDSLNFRLGPMRYFKPEHPKPPLYRGPFPLSYAR